MGDPRAALQDTAEDDEVGVAAGRPGQAEASSARVQSTRRGSRPPASQPPPASVSQPILTEQPSAPRMQHSPGLGPALSAQLLDAAGQQPIEQSGHKIGPILAAQLVKAADQQPNQPSQQSSPGQRSALSAQLLAAAESLTGPPEASGSRVRPRTVSQPGCLWQWQSRASPKAAVLQCVYCGEAELS